MPSDASYSFEWEDTPSPSRAGVRKGPIPITVGVTGHIDLDLRAECADEKMHSAIRTVLRRITQNAPNTPLVILSGLAEGADRLVTRIAMHEFGAKLVSVLPLPPEVYEKDFPKTVNEFRGMLAAGNVVQVPLVGGSTLEDVRHTGNRRNAQYAEAGAYIVRHSQVIIALWNGGDGGEGGTSDILEFARSGSFGPFGAATSPLDVLIAPPIYRIATPRTSTPVLVGKPFDIEMLSGKERATTDTVERFNLLTRRVEQFNEDCKKHEDALREGAPRSTKELIPPKSDAPLPHAVQRMARIFGIADILSIQFRLRQRKDLIWLLVASISAIIGFELYSHEIIPKEPWWASLVFAFYPAGLGLAWLIYRRAAKQRIRDKYLDYRALAEGLRVQIFWRLAGLSTEVADEYMIRHRTELDWIRDAIRAWNMELGQPQHVAHSDPVHDRQRIDLVFQRWIEDQRRFFTARKERDEKGEKTHRRWVGRLFITGVATAALFVIVAFILSIGVASDSTSFHHAHDFFEHRHKYVLFAIALLPVLAAARSAYAEIMAFSAQAQRYKWMAQLYSTAAKKMREGMDTGDSELVRTIIRDLGNVALEENGNWVLMHRDHPLEVMF